MKRLYLYTPRLRCTEKYKRPSFGVVYLDSSALLVGTSCSISCTLFSCSPFNLRSIRLAVARSFSHLLNRHKTHAQALGGRVLCSCVAPSPSLVVRSASFKVHSCKVTRRRLHCHVASCQCSTTRTKYRMDSCLQPNKNTVEWDINVDEVFTSSSTSKFMNVLESEGCRRCI